jgi:ribosomal protein S18 acetylase RimI-like enzyme
MSPIRIVRGGAERIPDLEPLWLSLRAHHASVAPQLGPLRTPADSWRRRRAKYERWLREPDAFALIAEAPEGPVGYAMVRFRDGPDTWETEDRVAELETLSVLPDARKGGIGTALVDAVRAEVRRLAGAELWLTVVATNTGALQFYDKCGFTPVTFALRHVLVADERE